MDERITRIENKLDKIVDLQGDMKADLQEHIRRTEIAEGNIDKLALAMAPVQEHVAFIRVITKLISGAVAVAAVVAAFLSIK